MNRYLLALILALSALQVSAQSLFLNEFMASNATTIRDPDYLDYADWIEIYNQSAISVNLRDYTITDNLTDPDKYRFQTDVIIPAGGYLLIWADDRNTGTHTNFKLSASGESLGLFSPSGQLLDSVSFGVQQTDISLGRYPDATGEWYLFSPASPGAINSESGIFNKLQMPEVSVLSGFYSNPFLLTVSHTDTNATIRFTTDGSIPDETSPFVDGAIPVDSTSVFRFRAFRAGALASAPLSVSYFINETATLPVFSLVTDPDNFFSDTSGIYVIGTNGITGNCSNSPRNWNQDWVRPVSLTLFEKNRVSGFTTDVGVGIFGGCSRIYAMKSLAFYFKSEFGPGKLTYRLFPDRAITEYNNFILRSSGQDWWRTMFRDGMVQTLIRQRTSLDCQAYRPALVFLNGDYWGIHNLREKINEHYIESHYGVPENNLDLIEISKAVFVNHGDSIVYNDMINYLSTHNMAQTANYEYIKSIVDIDNYIDYQIVQIYAANGDWPGANSKLWRERSPNGRWRWMVYDLDFTFGGNSQGQANTNTLAQATATNGSSWPNPPWSTLMFRKLLENTEFRNEFIQRFAVHTATTFDSLHVHAVIDSIAALIASEIPRHKNRWAQSISMGSDWQVNIKVMKDFATKRPTNTRGHFNQKFGLQGSYSLTVTRNNQEWGKVLAHAIELDHQEGTYIFFKNIPLKLRALPMPGYRFVRWEGASTSQSERIDLMASANGYLRAVFEPAPLAVTDPVINEINYKSSPLFDTEDWIELYNPLDTMQSLAGWRVTGNNTASFLEFDSTIQIPAKGYVVVCRDTAKFRALQSENLLVTGNLPFGLSSSQELIMLQDAAGVVRDSVRYYSASPWVQEPNGTGATLSLINPQSDNAMADSWKSSKKYGTPGRLNDVYTDARGEENVQPTEFELSQNYPNPFNPTTTIMYTIPQISGIFSAPTTLRVFDILGREVATLVNEVKSAGTYEVEFNAIGLPSGIYLYRLQSGNTTIVKKMVLLR